MIIYSFIGNVQVDPLSKRELPAVPGTDPKARKQVPVAEINGQVIGGSENIVNELITELDQPSSPRPDFFHGVDNPLCQEWNEWADKTLAVRMYPNLCKNYSSAKEAFSYVNQITSWPTHTRLVCKPPLLPPDILSLASS